MLARIVVPLDGSKFAEDALARALTLTDRSSQLDLITVVEGPSPFAGHEYVARAKEWAKSYLDEVIAKLPPGVVAEPHVLVGTPSREIRASIDESTANLVVMASHGRGPVTRVWLGSMADYLIRTSSVPLLLVHPGDGEEPSYQADRPMRKILVPLDGSELAETAAEGAWEIFGSDVELELIRVVQYPLYSASGFVPDMMYGSRELLDQATTRSTDYLAEAAQRLRKNVASVTTEVTMSDSPARAILDRADSDDFDAVSIATHGRGGISRLALGSIADKVIRQARIPVLTFRPTVSKAEAREMVRGAPAMTGV